MLISLGPVIGATAQPETKERSDIAEKILQMYNQARELALTWASRAEQAGYEDVSNELKRAVETADDLINQAKEKLEAGDVAMAAELARKAINTLRKALLKVKDEYISTRNATGRKEFLLSAIRRLKGLIQRLEGVLRALEGRGVDVSQPRQKLERAKEVLDDAIGLINEGKMKEAKEKVEEAADLLREVISWIREQIKEVKKEILQRRVQRIVSAAERTTERLQKLEEWLIEHNRTEAAAKVAEAKDALTQALRKFNEAVDEQNYSAAREALREMLSILKRLRQYFIEYRSHKGVSAGTGG
jgi:tetratricopeptide (TPR) repeat protein